MTKFSVVLLLHLYHPVVVVLFILTTCAVVTVIPSPNLHGLHWNLPHQVKTQYLHFRFYANYFLLPWKISEEISRRSMLSHNFRIYHINHMYIQPFTTAGDWPEIGCLKEVSTIFYTCRCCVFTWWGRPAQSAERQNADTEKVLLSCEVTIP